MDEPLCFVHFINASTCSLQGKRRALFRRGGNRNAWRVLCSLNLYPLGRAVGSQRGSVSEFSGVWSSHSEREEAASLFWSNFKLLVLEQDIFWEGTTAQGNLCCKTGTCLSDFLNQGHDPKIGSDR